MFVISIPFEISDTELSSKQVYSKLLQSDSSAPILSCQWASFVSPTFQLSEHWSWFKTTLRRIIRMTFSSLSCYVLLGCMRLIPGSVHAVLGSRPSLSVFLIPLELKWCRIDFFGLSESRFMDYWICRNFCTVSSGSVNINLYLFSCFFDYSVRELFEVSTT